MNGRVYGTAVAAFVLAASLSGVTEVRAEWKVDRIVPGSQFHGIHGITTDKDGTIFAGSVIGQAIYRVDPETGEASEYIGPPHGMADDLEFAPDGTLAWTAFNLGKVYAMKPGGPPMVVAEGLPGMNSLAFAPDGRLFATQVFIGDALYEIDVTGEKPARLIKKDLGGLNGFDFDDDGTLYGPIWFKQQIAKVDVETGAVTPIAEDFGQPAAANLDSKGNLWAVDTARGEVIRLDKKTGEKTVVANVKPAIDNLGFAPDDTLYITNMADNAVIRIDTETGEATTLIEGTLSIPGGVSLRVENETPWLYIADGFAVRRVNVKSNAVEEVGRVFGMPIGFTFNVLAANEKLYLGGWFANEVQVFDPDTKALLDTWHDLNAPMEMAAPGDGSVLVASAGAGTIMRIVGGEGGKDRTVLTDGLASPTGLALGGDGAVYVTETAAGKVTKVLLDGGDQDTILPGLNGPEGIALMADGRLAVVEVGARRVIAVDRASGATEVLATDLPLGLPATPDSPPAYIPTGIAAGPEGALYLTSDLENAVLKLTKN